MIAIGIVIVIAIAGIALGLTLNTGNETKISPNSTNTASTPLPPVTHGRNLSVNLTESVGVGAH